MIVSRELFDQQRLPRFGKANPERMTHAFWEWMIRGDDELRAGAAGRLNESDLQLRDGKLKSMYGPYRAQNFFNVPLNPEDGPILDIRPDGANPESLAGRETHLHRR